MRRPNRYRSPGFGAAGGLSNASDLPARPPTAPSCLKLYPLYSCQRARGCRRRSGDSKEGLSGGSGRFAAVARASGSQEVAQRGHHCSSGEGRAVANLYFRIS